MKKITILDSTLRDGAQGEGISFSVKDKIHICQALDELGIQYIEAGNPGSNPKDMEFFQEIKKVPLKNARVCAFGATRRKDTTCEQDSQLQSLLQAVPSEFHRGKMPASSLGAKRAMSTVFLLMPPWRE